MTAETDLLAADKTENRRTGADTRAFLLLLALVAAGADGLLMARAVDVSPPVFSALHLTLAALVGLAACYGTTNRTPALLFALGTACLGPLGAIGTAIICLRLAPAPQRRDELSRWHRQLSGAVYRSDAQTLYEDIVEGRAYQPGSVPPGLGAVMASGSIGDRQAALGLLLNQKHSVPPHLIEMALRSRDVAVRASAAAVVARLRDRPEPASPELPSVQRP